MDACQVCCPRRGGNAIALHRTMGSGHKCLAILQTSQLLIKLSVVLCLAIFSAFPEYAGARITLSADNVQNSFLDSKSIQVSLAGPRASVLEIKLDEVAIEEQRWRDLRFSCPVFQIKEGTVRCEDGVLRIARMAPLPVMFRFSPSGRMLEASIKNEAGGGNGGWKLSARWGAARWEGTVTVVNGHASRIAAFLPAREDGIVPSSTQGRINGRVQLHGQSRGVARMDANLALDGVAFSDAAGLHAGENISIGLNAEAARDSEKTGAWKWRVEADWPNGEVFWQPLYFAGQGHHFSARGELDEQILQLREGKLALAGIGEMEFSGVVDTGTKALREFDLAAHRLQLAGLFEQVLQPFLVNTPFAQLKAAGQAGIQWRYRDRAHQLLDVGLRDVSVEDGQDRFALHGMDAHIPWQAGGGQTQKGEITITHSRIGRIPIGSVHVPLEITGLDQPGVRIPRMTVPLLDGQFTLEQFGARRQAREIQGIQGIGGAQGAWQWEFSGRLTPISMQKLTEALGVQTMQGTLSGEIPKVSYRDSVVDVEGALIFRVFDGSVVVWNLKALDPLGRASSLMADVDMRNLDLNLLTGTFSFGNMLGRIDIGVHNLELFDWKPVKFDASLKSSPGEYPRRISQDAVQNISSLGGSSAAAAIQRSALRFFDEFGYSQIGWSCVLRNDICRMGGIPSEPLPHGYLIVKGGGIPAITVIGYNRDVDWRELVGRLQRITEVNAKPVIQ